MSEAFERWLRSVCFQAPTPEAYDLAKCAWDHMDAKLQAAKARIAELEAARVIPDSGGHLESADCWCAPTVEEHPGGTLVIHNQIH